MKIKTDIEKKRVSLNNPEEQKTADALRVLSADAVQKAGSGHPGMPQGRLWPGAPNVIRFRCPAPRRRGAQPPPCACTCSGQVLFKQSETPGVKEQQH